MPMIHGSTTKPPRLRLKAADARRFVPILHFILEKFLPRETEHDVMRCLCFGHLRECYLVIDHWADGGESSRLLVFHGRRFLMLYCELRRASTSPALWRLYPMFHFFAHNIENARSNPRDSWSYARESIIGDASAIAAGCNVNAIRYSLMSRYVILMADAADA